MQIGGQDYFLGKAFRSAEAAARAVDRATIAIQGRDGVETNFPLEAYPEEVCHMRRDDSRTAAGLACPYTDCRTSLPQPTLAQVVQLA